MYLEYCRGPEYGGDQAELAFERILSDPLRKREFDRSHKLADDPRVTRSGRFLRRWSLDELPQLINVIHGHISLVGPRPITADEFTLYGGDVARETGHGVAGYWEIRDLRPGITGYWQINGRSQIGYDERVLFDMAYASSMSLKTDLTIMAKTLRTLVGKNGAY